MAGTAEVSMQIRNLLIDARLSTVEAVSALESVKFSLLTDALENIQTVREE